MTLRAFDIRPAVGDSKWFVRFSPEPDVSPFNSRTWMNPVRDWLVKNVTEYKVEQLSGWVICFNEEDAMLLYMAFR